MESKSSYIAKAKNYRKGKNSMTGALKSADGEELLTEPEHISQRWKQYFEALLNVEDLMRENDENLVHEEVVNDGNYGEMDEITREEVINAIKKMKNGKATGEDGIPSEIFKALDDVGVTWLRRIFNIAWDEGRIPDDWRRAIVCPIYKKGDKTRCENYRGISLLSHAGKIYERVLEQRLRGLVEEKIGKWQHGFRPGKGTVDLIFAMKLLLEKDWEWNKDKYAVFIDMEKAFDRVPRKKLWEALGHEEYGIPGKLKRAIKSILYETMSKVRGRDMESEWFEVRTGVRQGGVISPLLFIIYMDRCMKEICDDDNEITFAYADDIAVITDNEQQLQNAMNRWENTLRTREMKINVNKTEVMYVGRRNVEVGVEVGSERLKQVTSFKYLGVCFEKENKQDIELNNRICKYNSNISMLYPLLKDRNIPRKCKTTIYTTILRPILTYGSEAWTLTSRTRSKIQAAEMRVLRMIKGVTRRDRMRNDEIRRELGVVSILEMVERSKLRWYGHVQRMNENQFPRKYLEYRPQGRRPVGRPRRRWIEGVGEALAARGSSLTEVEREETFANRQEWRRIVHRYSVADRH